MATFKVGQRVRIRIDANCAVAYRGKEALIVAAHDDMVATWPWDWELMVDGSNTPVYARERALEPLTDPLADSWADRKVRQVTKPQHTEPVAPRLREPVQ